MLFIQESHIHVYCSRLYLHIKIYGIKYPSVVLNSYRQAKINL
uniref:Uncharacterized protein n=1 Tax=Anguilla anguilla TaxID=7936 RepID=A0A0E9WEU0_ANGAN